MLWRPTQTRTRNAQRHHSCLLAPPEPCDSDGGGTLDNVTARNVVIPIAQVHKNKKREQWVFSFFTLKGPTLQTSRPSVSTNEPRPSYNVLTKTRNRNRKQVLSLAGLFARKGLHRGAKSTLSFVCYAFIHKDIFRKRRDASH